MAALENDIIRLHFSSGTYFTLECRLNSIPWPPPETLIFIDSMFIRKGMSTITDEQALQMPFVLRGALYEQVESFDILDRGVGTRII